jgi:hypothetical protein
MDLLLHTLAFSLMGGLSVREVAFEDGPQPAAATM